MARRKFDKQFKNSAVKLILEEGYSVKEVSQELEVHANSLYRWVQEVEEYGESAFPGNTFSRVEIKNGVEINMSFRSYRNISEVGCPYLIWGLRIKFLFKQIIRRKFGRFV